MQPLPFPQQCYEPCWSPHQSWVHLALAQVPAHCGCSRSCLTLKVINQLFNYLAAPGKKAGFTSNQTVPQERGHSSLCPAIPVMGRGGYGLQYPQVAQTALPQHPGQEEDSPQKSESSEQ